MHLQYGNVGGWTVLQQNQSNIMIKSTFSLYPKKLLKEMIAKWLQENYILTFKWELFFWSSLLHMNK